MKEMLNLSQQDYVNRIDDLNQVSRTDRFILFPNFCCGRYLNFLWTDCLKMS